MVQQLADIFRSLRVRNYRLFATGQLTSLLGRWMQMVAVDWLVLELSGNSGAALGFVMALQFAPVLLLSLYGGKLADRHDKHRMLLTFNAAWLLLSIALAINVIAEVAKLWHVYVFALVLGVIMALENPVRQAFVSEMVDAGMLPNALSLSSATFNSARIIGPALAGAFIAIIGTGFVLALVAFTYLPPLVCILMMRRRELGVTPPAKDTRIREGISYTLRRSDLVLPLILMFIIGGLSFNFPITLALLSKTVFRTGAATFGLLTTMLAAGALAGALVSSRRRSRPSAHIVLGAAAVFGTFEALVGLAPAFWMAALLLVPTGFAMTYLAQAVNQRLQLGVDAAHRGRVMALYLLVFLGSTPIFAPVIGWLSEIIGPRSGLWIGGLTGVVSAAVAFAVRCRKHDLHISLELRPRPRMRLIEAMEKVA